jgi:hypothetical protein
LVVAELVSLLLVVRKELAESRQGLDLNATGPATVSGVDLTVRALVEVDLRLGKGSG